MQQLQVRSANFDYNVLVGRGAWRKLRRLRGYSSSFVVTERHLWRRWGAQFQRESGLKNAPTIFVPTGEASKSLRMVEQIAGQLLERGADRRSLLIALGGGVIGDLTGFVASAYMRGIDYVQVPTTVVAQVDSAIGGKTAVNIRAMKNLIGSFYPPRLVLSDPTVLSSLDPRAFRSGFFEIVKHAVLDGERFFTALERCVSLLAPDKPRMLEPILIEAAKVKVDIVSRDEREGGLRRVLNLGHTFGHALEEATGYRRFLHGEAVAWGLLVVTRLAERQDLLNRSESERIARLVRSVGPLPNPNHISDEKVLRLLPRDKKAVGGHIHWVLPERIGKVRVVKDVPLSAVAAAWRDVQRGWWHE